MEPANRWRSIHQVLPGIALCAVLAFSAGRVAMAAETSSPRSLSGWRGGIGIAFGTPSRDIPDVTELGYEIIWGGEDPRAVKALDLAVFRYWNSIVETSLKDSAGRYDYSGLEDKNEAARRAFDAWAALSYGVPGLSKYAEVRYYPQGSYGDVYGSMDLSSENALVQAVINTYMDWFDKNGVRHGGIGLDNAGRVPRAFLEALQRRLRARGLGIAANGCPDEYLSYIDFFGNEGFPFTIDFARAARSKGFRGILGEFTMQQLSPGEMAAYLKSKLFNGIVFFGYTNGGTAAGAQYSFYTARPDVYDHQRWVFRQLIPLSRAVQRAGRQESASAWIVSGSGSRAAPDAAAAPASVRTTPEGKVVEAKRPESDIHRITGRAPTTPPAVIQYGHAIADGIYLYVDSAHPEEVACDARKLGIGRDTLVFDEFAQQTLPVHRSGDQLTVRTGSGPSVVQLGSRSTIVRSILDRIDESLRGQLRQRKMDRELGARYPAKAWSRFCQGWTLDKAVARSGRCSMKAPGGTYTHAMPQWKYCNRQGAAQFVVLNQTAPERIVLRAYSKAEDVPQVDAVSLDSAAARRRHFDAREGHTYAVHLYLDYQDGAWPEVHTVSFAAGSHDWEERAIAVTPARPVKTAMVLLEFHQPQGTAWFDDVFLAQGSRPKENLLAAPGFEEDDPSPGKLQSAGDEYESRAQALLRALATARNGSTAEKPLAALERESAALAAWVRDRGLARFWGRELRDLDDAAGKLRLCSRIAQGDAR